MISGVTPAQLASDNVPQKTSYVWGAADLSRELSVEPLPTLGEIPQVIRNEIKLRSRILQLRYDLWGWRDYLVFGKAFPPGAMVGEQHHRGRFGSSSLTDHPDPAHGSLYEELVRNAADTTVDGRWVPSPVRIQAMDAMLAACQARGVALIAYEVPVPTVYRALLPPNTYSDFYAEMDALEIPFVPLSDLGVTHTDAHFSDVVHMNLEGARLLSGPMVREVLVPAIERRAAEQ